MEVPMSRKAFDGILPGLLDRFIVGELLQPFVFGVLIFSVLLITGDVLFQIANLIIEGGVSLWTVSRLFLYKIPGVIVLTLPISCLMSTLLGFGTLSMHGEINALRSLGVDFGRVVRPVLLASLAVAFLTLLLSETVVPLTDQAALNILQYEVSGKAVPGLRENIFLRDESGSQLRRVLYVSKLNPATGTMQDVLVQDFDKNRLSRVSTAKKGRFAEGQWWLEEGKVFEVQADGTVKSLFSFERQRLALALSPQEVDRSSKRPQEMGLVELYRHIKMAEEQGIDTRPMWVIFNMRLAIPWAAVVLGLLGTSMGVRSPRGGRGVSLGLSVVVVFGYYVVMSFSRAFGEGGYLNPILSAWLPNLSFLAIGSILARKANG